MVEGCRRANLVVVNVSAALPSHRHCEKMMKLLDISRGHLVVEADEKSVTIYGEALLRGHGSPDFVLYVNSVDRWDAPNDNEKISEGKKVKIFKFIEEEFRNRKMRLEFDWK